MQLHRQPEPCGVGIAMAFSTELCIPDAEKPGGQSMNMTQKFTEVNPQQAIIGLLERQDYLKYPNQRRKMEREYEAWSAEN